uniref:C2H2-type domain-containing protein n=1 Tax=Plectus sambesii TaxID=2011161 RepID=A0A914XBZ3_9BILA
MNVDESVDDVIVAFSLDERTTTTDDVVNTHHELKRRSFDGSASSMSKGPSPINQLTVTEQEGIGGVGGPMWSTAKSEDDSSLDGFLPSTSKAAITAQSPAGEERVLPLPPASPFSELFPIRILSESGVDLADLNQQPTTSESTTKQHRLIMTHLMTAAQRTSKPHGAKSHFCTQCSAGFTRRYSLNKHMHEKHAPAPLRHCPLSGCTFVTRNPNSFLLHKRNHQQRAVSGKPQYFCKVCRCRYTQRRSLLQHLTNHHGSDASLFGFGGSGDSAATVPASPKSTVEHDPPVDAEPVEPPPAVAQEQIAAKKLTRSATRISVSSTAGTSVVALTDFTTATVAATVTAASPLSSPTQKNRGSKKSPPPSTSKKMYACERCDFSATTFRSLFAHRQKQHATKEPATIACVYCRKQFTSDRLVAHMKRSHLIKTKRSCKSGKRFVCDTCEFQTTTKRVFSAHKAMHAAEEQRAPPPTAPFVRPEAPTASVAPYVKSRRSPCPMVPTIPQELETVMNSLNQANSSLVQLVKRKDNELRDLRMNVSRLLQMLLPTSHPLQPALVRHLIVGPQIDQTVLSVISSHPAAI